MTSGPPDMAGADAEIVDRVHGLSDIELAVLLSLIGHEHCVIGTPEDAVDDLVDELGLISHSVLGLRCAVVDCHQDTTLEDFATLLFVPQHQHQHQHQPHSSNAATATLTSMANVVIAKNLNCAPEAVQIQALELMRTRHIFTTTAMQPVPKPFLLVAVVAAERGFLWDAGGADTSTAGPGGSKRAPHMTAHLNDFFSMGHWHDPEDGYPNVEEREEADLGAEDKDEHGTGSYYDDTGTDSDSIVRLRESGRQQQQQPQQQPPLFSEADIEHLAALAKNVRVDIEVLRYQMNIIAFLRIHRAVAVVGPGTSGLSCVSPIATKHFEKLAQCLAPLHRLDFVTPALVTLAARKTYLHRIRTVRVGHSGARLAAVHERSMQWGGEKAAVEALLEGVSPEDVIEGVLGSVAPPV